MNQTLRFPGRDVYNGAVSLLAPDRDVALGEALLAMTIYAKFDPANCYDADLPGALMKRCFSVLLARGNPFSVEDFALYFLSRMIDEVPATSHTAFRAGAARYLLEKRNRLSLEVALLADEAQATVAKAPRKQHVQAFNPATIPTEELNGDFGFSDDKRDAFVFDFVGSNEPGILLLT